MSKFVMARLEENEPVVMITTEEAEDGGLFFMINNFCVFKLRSDGKLRLFPHAETLGCLQTDERGRIKVCD